MLALLFFFLLSLLVQSNVRDLIIKLFNTLADEPGDHLPDQDPRSDDVYVLISSDVKTSFPSKNTHCHIQDLQKGFCQFVESLAIGQNMVLWGQFFSLFLKNWMISLRYGGLFVSSQSKSFSYCLIPII